MKIIVHGGAWNIPDEYDAAHLNGVQKAVKEGWAVLQKGGTALDAVERAVMILEEDPTFDSGRGAFLNAKGEIELDAFIMDGRSLDFGAVAAVQNILHPVSLARKVMEQTEHNFLVGKGAGLFAEEVGIPSVEPTLLLTERELAFFKAIQNDPNFHTKMPFEFRLSTPSDTVGAVALDQEGNIAAATSTGGTARKMVGRVGDSPIVGAGGYADNMLGGVSATGWGESIMKVVLSKRVVDHFENQSAMLAARSGIQYLEERVNGLGGVIGINKKGEYAFAHNTPKMAFAFAEDNDYFQAFMKAPL